MFVKIGRDSQDAAVFVKSTGLDLLQAYKIVQHVCHILGSFFCVLFNMALCFCWECVGRECT